MKCVMQLGALAALQETDCLKTVTNYIGTSGGAIMAYLLVLGYTPLELVVEMTTHHKSDVRMDLLGFAQGRGCIAYTELQSVLERLTLKKIGKFSTLSELHDATNKRLVVTTYNVTADKLQYIDYQSHPSLPTLTALRMSSSLPLLFERFMYNFQLFVDGGIADNFPINHALEVTKGRIIGLLIESEPKAFSENESMLEYIYRLLSVPIVHFTEVRVAQCIERCDVVRLQSNLRFFDINLSTQRKLDLFSDGYTAARNFISSQTTQQT